MARHQPVVPVAEVATARLNNKDEKMTASSGGGVKVTHVQTYAPRNTAILTVENLWTCAPSAHACGPREARSSQPRNQWGGFKFTSPCISGERSMS